MIDGGYSWDGIVDYIKSQKTAADKEKHDWAIEKTNLLALLNEKDSIIKSLQSDNKALLAKLTVLEYTIRQDSKKTQRKHHRINSDSKKSYQKLNSFDEPSKFSPSHRPSSSYGAFPESKFEKVSVPPAKLNFDGKILKNKPWSPKLSLKSHLDGVQDLQFLSETVLASASEDCTVKLWDCRSFTADFEGNESYLTMRGHSAPIFTIDGCNEILVTGDCNGFICTWTVPHPDLIEPYSDYHSYCSHKWQAHNDCIWSLQYNSLDHAIISASADNTVKLWKLSEEKLPNCKVFSFPGQHSAPSACNWIPSNMKYITVGYNSFIAVFNIETSGFTKIPFASDLSLAYHQVNTICTSTNVALTISGHEDKRIRFFDLNANSCVKDIVGHTDAVTDICIDDSGYYLISTGHDGSVRSWDLRTFHCLHEITLNRKKYDESIFCVAQHPAGEIIAIGGSDSIIKILEAKDS